MIHFNGEAKGAGRVSTSCSMILKEGGSALLNHKQTHLRIVSLITNSPWAFSLSLSLQPLSLPPFLTGKKFAVDIQGMQYSYGVEIKKK